MTEAYFTEGQLMNSIIWLMVGMNLAMCVIGIGLGRGEIVLVNGFAAAVCFVIGVMSRNT